MRRQESCHAATNHERKLWISIGAFNTDSVQREKTVLRAKGDVRRRWQARKKDLGARGWSNRQSEDGERE